MPPSAFFHHAHTIEKMQTGRAIRYIFCGSARIAKGCRFYPSRCMPFRNIYFYFRFGCLLSNSKEVLALSFMTIRKLNLLPELLFPPLIRLVFPLLTRLSISAMELFSIFCNAISHSAVMATSEIFLSFTAS